jgi:hypothetical protein
MREEECERRKDMREEECERRAEMREGRERREQ